MSSRILLAAFLGLASALALAHVRLVYEGNGNVLYWTNPGSVSVVIQANGSADVPDESDEVALKNAIDEWNKVDGTLIQLVEQTSAAQKARTDFGAYDLHTLMFDESNASGYFPGGSGTVALTPLLFYTDGRIVDGDVLFNGSGYQFTTSGVAGRFDIQDVATHELGHLVGLDHSGVAGATMYPYVDPTVILHRSLSQDDISGVRDAYPLGEYARLRGTLVRADGSPVKGAHVVALDGDGRVVGAGLSNTSGVFVLDGLAAGIVTVLATPLDHPVGAANLSAWHTIETDFSLTQLGSATCVLGQQTELGTQTAVGDGFVQIGRSYDDFPQRVIEGEVSSHFVRGQGLVPGSSLTPSDSRLTVLPSAWSSTSVQFQVVCPGGVPAGHVNLTVTTPSGEQAVLVGGLEVTPPSPAVASVFPTSANAQGGAVLTVNGTGFRPGCLLVIGNKIYKEGQAGGCTLLDSTRLRLIMAPTSAGVHDVVVIDSSGAEGRAADGFWAQSAPTIQTLFPAAGQSTGGTLVQITGTNLQSGSTVTIDGIPQLELTYISSTLLEVRTEPGAPGAQAMLVVHAPTGEEASALFTYQTQADPILTNVDPPLGPAGGGNSVQLSTLNLTASTEVLFGGNPQTGEGAIVAAIESSFAEGVVVQVPGGLSGTVAIILRDTETGQAAITAGAYTFAPKPSVGGGCASVSANGPRDLSDVLAGAGWLLVLGLVLLRRARQGLATP